MPKVDLKNYDRLSDKQKAWLDGYLDTQSSTYLNKAKSARVAGYKGDRIALGVAGHRCYERMEYFIKDWMEFIDLPEDRIKKKLIEGMTCTETKFFTHQGVVVEERTVIPWNIRAKFLDMALKLKGLYAPDKHVFTTDDDGVLPEMSDELLEKVASAILDDREAISEPGTDKLE